MGPAKSSLGGGGGSATVHPPMRTLTEPPSSIFDPSTRALRAGSYRGGIPRVDPTPLGKGPLFRIAQEKRWLYTAVATDNLFIGAAIVRPGSSRGCRRTVPSGSPCASGETEPRGRPFVPLPHLRSFFALLRLCRLRFFFFSVRVGG